jgi:Tol biopolymer transport system component
MGNRNTAIGNGTGGVFVVPAGGGEPVRLGREVPAAASPTWSPDGRSLLVYGFPEKFGKQNDDWWVVPVDGSASRRTGSTFAAAAEDGDLTRSIS